MCAKVEVEAETEATATGNVRCCHIFVVFLVTAYLIVGQS